MTNTHPTAIVYGPQGCGKSTHAHEIAHRLRIPRSNIIDEANITRARHIKPGFLHLCIAEPFGIPLPHGCVVLPYAHFGFPDLRPGAMEAIPVYRGGQTGAPTVTMESPAETRAANSARLRPFGLDMRTTGLGVLSDQSPNGLPRFKNENFTPLPPPSAEDVARMRLTNEIERERRRQIAGKGYQPETDDHYIHGELARAAAVYTIYAALPDLDREHAQGLGPMHYSTDFLWPWDNTHFKLTNPRRDLIKAAALILAELERLDRAQTASGCTCMEVFGEDPACKLHGRDTDWAKANPENGI